MRGDLQRALLEKEMTRKEFLQIIGGSLLVLTGLANFVNLLQRHAKPQASAQNKDSSGFGSRRFGA